MATGPTIKRRRVDRTASDTRPTRSEPYSSLYRRQDRRKTSRGVRLGEWKPPTRTKRVPSSYYKQQGLRQILWGFDHEVYDMRQEERLRKRLPRFLWRWDGDRRSPGRRGVFWNRPVQHGISHSIHQDLSLQEMDRKKYPCLIYDRYMPSKLFSR